MMLLFLALLAPSYSIDNGLALTPPMGFANWNVFGCDYNDTTFRSMADAFVSTGLAAAGYKYMLVQECITPAGARDADGRMVVDAAKFPHGFKVSAFARIPPAPPRSLVRAVTPSFVAPTPPAAPAPPPSPLKDLCDYFHSKGLLCGIYTDVAHLTCANFEGSGPGPANPAGHWAIDALTFASWGVDLIEADFCNTEGTNMSALQLYEGARDAIAAATAATGQKMALYQCNWGAEEPWNWAPTVANLFRATGDICSPGRIAFNRILSNFDNTIVHSGTPGMAPGQPGTGIGAWLDPDMLGPGMVGITDTEGRTQFSLWCILAAPLFLGTDVRNASAFTLATVGNLEAIAINQDALGVQGRVATPSAASVPYEGGVLLNLTSGAAPAGAGTWLLQPDGQVLNAASGQALTIYACDTAPGTVVFAYDATSNTCGNQLWRWDAATGALASRMLGGGGLCLAGVNPAGGPPSQLVAATCAAGAPEQTWTWAANGSLALAAAWGGVSLQQFTPPAVNLYVKPLLGGDLALAVLNRGANDLASGAALNLTDYGFAPQQKVAVLDVWAAATLGPFAGGFTTRAIASHETLLLRLSPV